MPLPCPLSLCNGFFPKILIKCRIQGLSFLCVNVYMALVSFDRDTHAVKGCTDLSPNPLSLDCVTTDFQPSKTTWSGVKLRLKTR